MIKILNGRTLSFLFLFLLFPQILLAFSEDKYIEEIGSGTPILERTDLEELIYKIIQTLLSFLGVGAILIILYSGFLWMTAGGSEEKVSKAKKILAYGITGLVVIILAYALSTFVIYLARGELPG